MFTSYAVLDYLDDVNALFGKKEFRKAITEVKAMQQRYIDLNMEAVERITKDSPEIVTHYQQRMIGYLIGK